MRSKEALMDLRQNEGRVNSSYYDGLDLEAKKRYVVVVGINWVTNNIGIVGGSLFIMSRPLVSHTSHQSAFKVL